MKTRSLLSGSFLGYAVLALAGTSVACSRQTRSVTVIARGPGGLRIEGKGRVASVEDDGVALTFRVPIAPLDTGIGLRNDHLRGLLDVDRYPIASLRVARSELRFPGSDAPAEGVVDGELTLHGETRPVTVRYRAEAGTPTAGVMRLRGSFQLDLRDFSLRNPSYLGVILSPQIEVRAQLAVKGLEALPGALAGSRAAR